MDDPLSRLEKRLRDYIETKVTIPLIDSDSEWMVDYGSNYVRLVGPEEAELVNLIKLVLDRYEIS